jgi:hypothetical protein
MTPEQRKAYQEYLDDFDPTPIGYGEDYLYPLSEDGWLEEQEDNSLPFGYCVFLVNETND